MITPKLNKVYLVTHRTWDNKRLVTAKRRFLGMEKRFKAITCYVFTSRLTKRVCASELSIPHYDLKDIKEV
jgi:hypothetical protein